MEKIAEGLFVEHMHAVRFYEMHAAELGELAGTSELLEEQFASGSVGAVYDGKVLGGVLLYDVIRAEHWQFAVG